MANPLDPADAELLRQQFRPRHLADPLLCEFRRLSLELQPPGWRAARHETAVALQIRQLACKDGLFAAIPCSSLPLLDAPARIANGMPHVTASPVVRERIDKNGLSPAHQESLARWLAQRFSGAPVRLVALYPEVPPECAGSLSVAPDYASVQFTPASATAPARAGFFLAIVDPGDGKTRKLLIRL